MTEVRAAPAANPTTRRTLTAIIAIPPFLAALYWDGPWWSGLVLLLALLGAWEWIALTRTAGYVPAPVVVLPATVALYGAVVFRPGALLAVLGLVLLAALAAQLWAPARTQAIGNAGVTVLGPLYVTLFAALDLLRRLPDGWQWTVVVVGSVWVADSAAYFGGRSLGRRPLAPAISPKKTWEGVWSGALGGLAAGVLLGVLLGLPLGPAAAIGALGASVGLIGDLAESALKRAAGVKDSGTLLPGHGGVLDRFDATLFVAPVAYVLLRLWPR